MVRLGRARLGGLGSGQAGRGSAGYGEVRLGGVWQGMAWFCLRKTTMGKVSKSPWRQAKKQGTPQSSVQENIVVGRMAQSPRVAMKESWWVKHSSPEDREQFIEAARARAREIK